MMGLFCIYEIIFLIFVLFIIGKFYLNFLKYKSKKIQNKDKTTTIPLLAFACVK